jgi:bromodomain-containing factor 1
LTGIHLPDFATISLPQTVLLLKYTCAPSSLLETKHSRNAQVVETAVVEPVQVSALAALSTEAIQDTKHEMAIMAEESVVPQSSALEHKTVLEQASDEMVLDSQEKSNGYVSLSHQVARRINLTDIDSTETNGHTAQESLTVTSAEVQDTNGDTKMGEGDVDAVQNGKLDATELPGPGLPADSSLMTPQPTEHMVAPSNDEILTAPEHIEQPVSDAGDEVPPPSSPSLNADAMAIDEPIEPQEPVPTPAVTEAKLEQVSTSAVEDSLPQLPAATSTDKKPSDSFIPQTASEPHPTTETMANRVRQRDDDDENEPLAKRTKVTPEQESSVAPSAAIEPGAVALAPMAAPAPYPVLIGDFDSKPMTKPQLRYLLDSVRKAKKIKAALPFLAAVDPIAMNIPTYPTIVPHPMDLGTIEEKLKNEQYSTANALWTDLELMVQNAYAFNGLQHPVTQSGLNLRAYFNKLMQSIPKGDAVAEGGAKKAATASPKPTLPRRESRHVSVTKPSEKPSVSQIPTVAAPPVPKPTPKAPVSKPKAETKKHEPVLDSNGVPVIRRASESERPKREIIKPPPRDLPYTTAKPKKKQSQLELKFCEQVVMKELKKSKHQANAWPFMNPVDPVALNIPTYYTVVKKPMDFGTIEKNMQNGVYGSAKDFLQDAKLVFKNCYLFNPVNDTVHNMGKDFEAVFDEIWGKKDEWVSANQPVSEPASEEESEAESSDDEPELNAEERVRKVIELQKQIAALTAQVIELTNAPTVKPKKKDKSKAKNEKKQKRLSTTTAPPSARVSKSKKAAKPKKLSLEQKRYVSEGIMMLDEANMRKAVQMIRNGVPKLRVCFSLSFPFLSFPFLSFPFLSFPFLSFPFNRFKERH